MSGEARAPAPPGAIDTCQLRPVFAVGTGRCGTHFLAQLLAREPGVASHHERHPFADAFHRWCVWNRIAVDAAGFLATKERGIRADLAAHAVSFEASAYLSLSVPLLHQAFGARAVLLVRRPDQVVSSFLRKGWFEQPTVRSDARLPAGYQPDARLPHHPFARLVGIGDDGARWSTLSRVGQVAYFWARLNAAVLDDFARLPDDSCRVVRIESLDHAAYRALSGFMGTGATLARDEFDELARLRPGHAGPVAGFATWSAAEVAEFEAEVAPLAERLGYEWRCRRLAAVRDEPAPVPAGRSAGRADPRWIGRWLARLRRTASGKNRSGA